MRILLSILFSSVCVLSVLLWAWRQCPPVRLTTLALFALNCTMAILQATPFAEDITHDRWRYLEAQADFADYLETGPSTRVPIELWAGFTDRVLGSREAIGTTLVRPIRTATLNPAQTTVGAVALLLSGGWTAAPGLLWATLVALSVGYFARVAAQTMPAWRTWVMGAIIVLAPATIWFRTVNTKEPLILACACVIGALMIRIGQGDTRVRRLAALGAVSVVMFLLRPAFALLVLLGFGTGLLVSRRLTATTIALGAGFSLVVLAIMLDPSRVEKLGSPDVGRLSAKQLAPYYVEEMMEARSEYGGSGGGADVMRNVFQRGPSGFVYLPVMVGYFVLGPFPWQGGSMLMQLGKLHALVYWVIAFLLLRNLVLWRRLRPEHRVFVWTCVVIVVAMSIVETNLGTAMRHRTTWEPLVFYAALAIPIPRATAQPPE